MPLLNYRLPDSALEQQFRQSRFDRTLRFAKLTTWLVFIVVLAFLPLGLIHHATHPHTVLYTTIARAISAGAILVLLIHLYRIKNWVPFEVHIFITEIIVITHLLVANWAEPENITIRTAWNVLAIFMLYVVIPIALEWQIGAAAVLTTGSLLIWFFFTPRPDSLVALVSTPIVYFTTNLFGFVHAIQHKRNDRAEFRLLRNERALRQSKDAAMRELSAQTAAKERLFAVISHDLRSPLAAIVTIGEILSEGEDPVNRSERESLTRSLVDSAGKTHELLDNLLQWALHESNMLIAKPANWDLDPICQRCLALLEATATQKGVELVAEGNLQHRIHADERMIQTVLRNLLGNALKFTPSGGRVSIEAGSSSDGAVVIRVKDNGVGMPSERIEELMGDHPVSPTRGTDEEKGTGLGFRLCREFVEKNNGQLTLESTEGAGTTVSFSVPLAKQSPLNSSRRAGHHNHPAPAGCISAH